jgi:hypothetical protein
MAGDVMLTLDAKRFISALDYLRPRVAAFWQALSCALVPLLARESPLDPKSPYVTDRLIAYRSPSGNCLTLLRLGWGNYLEE